MILEYNLQQSRSRYRMLASSSRDRAERQVKPRTAYAMATMYGINSILVTTRHKGLGPGVEVIGAHFGSIGIILGKVRHFSVVGGADDLVHQRVVDQGE